MSRKAARASLMTIGGVVTAVGLLVVLVEIGLWFSTGTWSPHSVSWAIGAAPVSAWPGLNKVLVWLLDRPLWGAITSAGLMVTLAGSAIE